MRLMTTKTVLIALSLLVLTSCKYTFTEEAEIEEQLLKITEYGVSADEARTLVNNEIGEDSYWGHGIAEKTPKGWVVAGAFLDPKKKIKEKPYYFTYKLGSYPSSIVVLPTYVFARWFFNSNDQLVEIEVIKETDGI